MQMKHKGCGGQILEDHSHMYTYVTESGTIEFHPRLNCAKCGREIVGDSQIEDEDNTP